MIEPTIEPTIEQTIEQTIEPTTEPVSLYIHIPFCKSKCNYCDFLSFAHEDDKIDEYITALVAEIRSYHSLLRNNIVKSIFIGGGTPSVIEAKYIESIMKEIKENFNLEPTAEITIECNPGTISREKGTIYKILGINRISLGLQAVDNERLKHLGRIHTFEEFAQNFNMLREIGYDNINVDLMFGLPNQTLGEWKETLKQVLILNPEHISVYGLLVEEDTPYYSQYQQKKWELPDEEIERTMYWYANECLAQKGYEHYEISNYSKKGFSCKHNKVYWTLGKYIGIGLGAASYYDQIRMDNTRNIDQYMNAQGDLNEIISNKAPSTIIAQKEEFMFLGLRLMEGISKKDYLNKFNQKIEEQYGEVVFDLIKQDLLIEEGDRLSLTNKGIDISNYVLAKFIL
ncbi:MAG: coproporphyrinogen III oxidase [Firmicutes bacterium HGW-Firmicutes-1]|nr:MAG: coproporphyrinogen III oxidase [Firmicutes bacterium HGW-Firmicutes-1]